MNTEKFESIIEKRIRSCIETLSVKSNEYATEDRLHNFKSSAAQLNCTPIRALAGMMVKHTDSVYRFIDWQEQGKVITDEMWDEKIGDSINYLLLLTALIEEMKGEQ